VLYELMRSKLPIAVGGAIASYMLACGGRKRPDADWYQRLQLGLVTVFVGCLCLPAFTAWAGLTVFARLGLAPTSQPQTCRAVYSPVRCGAVRGPLQASPMQEEGKPRLAPRLSNRYREIPAPGARYRH
jgi:hypothetical protein